MFDGAAYPYKPSRPIPLDPFSHGNEGLFYYRTALSMDICHMHYVQGVTLAQLVKASVGQADVQRFEPHLGHNLLSCGVFLVKSPGTFGSFWHKPQWPNWQSLSAGGSVAIQTWSIYKVYT